MLTRQKDLDFVGRVDAVLTAACVEAGILATTHT